MARNFRELEEKMSPEARARSDVKARKMLAEIELTELRERLQLTQVDLAKRMKITQSSVSNLEKRRDVMVSTLRRLIKAMGGELEIRAIFPDTTIRLDYLGKQ
jgi:DNA-binding transcriptional regulator YiaG